MFPSSYFTRAYWSSAYWQNGVPAPVVQPAAPGGALWVPSRARRHLRVPVTGTVEGTILLRAGASATGRTWGRRCVGEASAVWQLSVQARARASVHWMHVARGAALLGIQSVGQAQGRVEEALVPLELVLAAEQYGVPLETLLLKYHKLTEIEEAEQI